MVKLQFLGAAQTVTGSRTIFNFHGNKYLVDCGLFQGPKSLRELNWLETPQLQDLKSVILTHAHIDHSGYLPKLYRDGYRGPIYSSYGTAELCEIMLPDSGHLQEEDARFYNRTRSSRHNPALPLYTQNDAVDCLKLFNPLKNNEWHSLEPGLSFRMLRSGHILGSTLIQLSYDSGTGSKIITFSGDLGNGRSRILKEPVQISETDELVIEGTYGDRIQPKGNELNQLGEIVQKVLGRGGTLVIPAFSVGRTQELLYMLHLLERDESIDRWPVFLDSPMATDVTELYSRHVDELKPTIVLDRTISPLRCTRFEIAKSADDSMLLCMNTEPKIVISAAGMLTGGRVLHHLKSKLPDRKSGVLFVGYQVPGTKGYLLKNGITTINLHHQTVDVEAEVFQIDSLSAHADSNEILRWIGDIHAKPKMIYLNHGEKTALDALAYRIQHELKLPCTVPSQGEEFTLTSQTKSSKRNIR